MIIEAPRDIAPVTTDMKLIENFAYYELLLLFQRKLTGQEVLDSRADPGPVGQPIDDASRGYGIGAWHLINGRDARAWRLCQVPGLDQNASPRPA